MKKHELALYLAERSKIAPGVAADQVDRLVRDILTRVRKGKTLVLPGLGTFAKKKGGPLTFLIDERNTRK